MLEKLTKEQESLMYVIRDNWLDKAYNPKQKVDEVIKKGINDLYQLCKLKKPKKIIIVDSPVGLYLLGNIMKNKASVGDSVRDSVWASVGASVGDSVWASVGDSVRASVRDSVWDSVGDWSHYVNYGDYGWCSYYHYFTQINILKNDKFTKFLEILDSGIYEWIGYEDVAIVCRLPKPLKWVEKNGVRVLHDIDGYAIEWNDGYGQYYIEGVSFNTKEGTELFKKISNKTLTVEEALKIENQEQRTVALKYVGWDKVVENNQNIVVLDEKMLTIGRKQLLHRVIEVDLRDDNVPARFLQFICPSTEKKGVLRVDPHDDNTKSVDGARKYGFKPLSEFINSDFEFSVET